MRAIFLSLGFTCALLTHPAISGQGPVVIPGKDFGSATLVAPGGIVSSTLKRDDKHYFKLVPKYSSTYVIFSRGGNNTWGTLYNSSYERLTEDRINGEAGNFRIAYRLNAGQTYYAVIQGQPGPYELHIEGPEGGTLSDDHGFSSWSATSVNVGTSTHGSIDVQNDQDYFRFTPLQRANYVIYTRGSTDTNGQLYDESFNLLQSDCCSGGAGNFRMAKLLDPGHAYYVLVRGQPGPYTLYVEGPESRYSAQAVKVGSVTSGRLEVPQDQDYYRFTPQSRAN